ncbi:hypothetical protein GCM10020218_093110 [Dactylosporangium vinaceum]
MRTPIPPPTNVTVQNQSGAGHTRADTAHSASTMPSGTRSSATPAVSDCSARPARRDAALPRGLLRRHLTTGRRTRRPAGTSPSNTDFDTFLAGAQRVACPADDHRELRHRYAQEAADWVRYANITKG